MVPTALDFTTPMNPKPGNLTGTQYFCVYFQYSWEVGACISLSGFLEGGGSSADFVFNGDYRASLPDFNRRAITVLTYRYSTTIALETR
jgi:hypothetical protein